MSARQFQTFNNEATLFYLIIKLLLDKRLHNNNNAALQKSKARTFKLSEISSPNHIGGYSRSNSVCCYLSTSMRLQ